MDNFKNEIYENLRLSEKTQERIVNAMENAAKSNKTPDTDNIRSIKPMRKKTHSDVLNRIAVASLSLGLSGALIAGIITYTKDNSVANKNIAKESTKDEFDNSDEEFSDINEYSTIKSFKKIDFSRRTSITQRVKIGVSTIELFYVQEDGTHEINVKQGKGKFVNVDKIDVNNHLDLLGYYAYGNALYYFDVNGLKKLDLNYLKTEYVMKFNEVNLATPDQYLFAMNDNYIYMSGSTNNPVDSKDSAKRPNEIDYMYSYNIKTKELNLLENRHCLTAINDTYFIASEPVKDKWSSVTYLEKIENGKVTTIKTFDPYTRICFNPPLNPNSAHYYTTPIGGTDTFYDGIPVNQLTERGIMFSEADNQKFYYTSPEKLNKDGSADNSESTIMSYNLRTNKTEKIASITAKKINDSDENFYIDIITDDYCEINMAPDEQGSILRCRYYFKTGKVEKI